MAEVTVKQLAEVVGAPVERLLKQMQQAGLPQKQEAEIVSDEEKQTLLAYLKKTHGGSDLEPKKVTLKRKITSTLRSASSSGRGKSVNIEVRKKRTYVKRDFADELATTASVADDAASAPEMDEMATELSTSQAASEVANSTEGLQQAVESVAVDSMPTQGSSQTVTDENVPVAAESESVVQNHAEVIEQSKGAELPSEDNRQIETDSSSVDTRASEPKAAIETETKQEVVAEKPSAKPAKADSSAAVKEQGNKEVVDASPEQSSEPKTKEEISKPMPDSVVVNKTAAAKSEPKKEATKENSRKSPSSKQAQADGKKSASEGKSTVKSIKAAKAAKRAKPGFKVVPTAMKSNQSIVSKVVIKSKTAPPPPVETKPKPTRSNNRSNEEAKSTSNQQRRGDSSGNRSDRPNNNNRPNNSDRPNNRSNQSQHSPRSRSNAERNDSSAPSTPRTPRPDRSGGAPAPRRNAGDVNTMNAGAPPGAGIDDNAKGRPNKSSRKDGRWTNSTERPERAKPIKSTSRSEKRVRTLMLDEDGEYQVRRHKARKKHKDENKHAFEKPTKPVIREVPVPDSITVGDLAQGMAVKSAEVIKSLVKMGVMATINQTLDQETAQLVVEDMGHTVKIVKDVDVETDVLDNINYEGELASRAPVVTVMGHVDHGKTSLLDYIRKAHVTKSESGGITQHIGAYHVETERGMICFLDTPGHAAFTSMRARGAKATDVVILVVAADDGVMPQTQEAVQHARAAGVPIVVAVNKMDKEAADPDRVKNELSALNVLPEDWGGDVQFIGVSAHTGQGIDELLDAVLLQSEMLELKSVPKAPAKGVVIESALDRGRGPVATLLVQNGTLNKGDIVVAGGYFGRARALLDESGRQIDTAGPSIPVEILGLDGTPDAGETFAVVAGERAAREVAAFRQNRSKEDSIARQKAAKLDGLFNDMARGDLPSLNIVLKTDVRGSLEALSSSLLKLSNEEVKVNIVSSGVGGIAGTDANLALASNAIVFGFNVRADSSAKQVIEKNNLDLRYYSVIYEMIDDVKSALSGLLSPELREEIVGLAEVRDVFNSPKFGQVAGCMVTEGTIYRNKKIRVLRENVVVFEGELESLRRFKDDVNEVRHGMECGIGVKNYTDVQVGDQIEVFNIIEVARTIDG